MPPASPSHRARTDGRSIADGADGDRLRPAKQPQDTPPYVEPVRRDLAELPEHVRRRSADRDAARPRHAPLTHERERDGDPDEVISRLWKQYTETGCTESRDQLVAHYMAGHVRRLAARLHRNLPAQVDLEDLVQQGYLGLIDAMQRYDLDRSTKFETFSAQRIIGAMHDYLRDLDPLSRLSRKRTKDIERLQSEFEKEHGRSPDLDEMQARIDLPRETLLKIINMARPASTVTYSTAGSVVDGEDSADAMASVEDSRTDSPLGEAARQDLQRWLTHGLSRRDRLIVILYYYEQMTMKEIGQTLGISESRVSQRLDSVLQQLRSRCTLFSREREGEFLPAR